MKKKIIILSVVTTVVTVVLIALIALIASIFGYNGKKSLDFEEVKFNTPEKVTTELGLKDLPEFDYVENRVHSEFNFDYWDCVVEFKFRDMLSAQEKNNIIKQVASKDELHWIYKDIGKDGIAEFYNIKYEDGDTTRYNIVITDDKIYVAYSDNLYQHLSDEIFKPSEYHLIGVRNAYVGFDSSHEWTIQLKKPYTQYVDRFNDGNWKREETSNILSFIKEIYSDGCKQSEERIDFDKKRNVAIISDGSF